MFLFNFILYLNETKRRKLFIYLKLKIIQRKHCVILNSNLFKIIQNYSNLFKLIQSYAIINLKFKDCDRILVEENFIVV
jgi:hypothetical protein